MPATLEELGHQLTTLEVSELVMLPSFTAADQASWPAVMARRPSGVNCAVSGDHAADMSTTIGHPHTGLPQRWLDLCRQHATALEQQFGLQLTGAEVTTPSVEAPSDDGGAAADHPYGAQVTAVATGEPAGGDPVQVLGPLPGSCDAVIFLPGRVVVAADVEHDWVAEQLAAHADRPPSDAATGPGTFLGALGRRLGEPPAYASVVATASQRASMLRGGLAVGGDPDPGWAAYRTDVQRYRYHSGNVDGHIDVGRGPAGRTDVYVRMDAARQTGGGPSRELMTAATSLAPSDALVFGSAPLHDTRALRTLVEGGFVPVGTEVLFLTRPRG